MSAVKIWVKALLRNIAWLLHPRLPWPLARRLLKRRVQRQLRSPYHQAVALQQMTHLLSDVATPDEIAAAARRYTEFALLEAELRWHPNRSTNQHVEGVEHLHTALAQGNGVVLHFAHHAFYSGMFGAIRKASGVDITALVRDKALGWNVGPSLRQHMLVVRRGGALVYTGEGSAGLGARLARGEVIAMASDTSGSSTPMFAGHQVKCSSGAVWTARKANAPIVIVDSFRVGDNHVVRLSPPIDPNDYEDPQELLQLLISAHEKAILAWPEATFAPVLSWQRAVPVAEAVVRETSVIAPKPLVKALVDNASWLLHLRLPWPIAERRLAKRIARAQQSPVYDAVAEEHMTHLLGQVATPEEIEQAKARYTAFSLHEAELRWHPRRAIDQQVEGIEHVRAAQALGRGVVVSFVHHGYYAGMFGAIKRAGVDHVTVVRAGALGWNAGPGQRQNFLVFRRGGRLIDVREGTAGFIKRLARGEVVMIATDIPGTSTVSFAGRQVKCSSGLVWAAKAANSPIVVLDSFRTENGHVVRFSKPLLPDDFEDTQSLLQEVVSQHEQAILAWPEAAFVPTLSWVSAEA
ncbi:MAG: LpxL/LpxP family acyltransferase [Marmoricola sp.]